MTKVEIGNLEELPYAMEEAVNRLRVNIGFLGPQVRKIMIISSFPNEGKSLISLHLFRQMSEAGVPTAFVDMDLRNSVLSVKNPLKVQDDQKVIGTSTFLSGTMELKDALCQTQYTSGALMFNMENIINPSILLEGKRFSDMLDQLAREYRYVFLDTPPLGFVSDGEAIGAQCDGAVLVIRSGVTPTAVVRNSIAQLERAGCPVLGVVLNRALISKGKYYSRGKYGYGGYGKYGSYGYGGYGEYYYGNKNNEENRKRKI